MVTSLVKREVAGSNPAGGVGGVRRVTPDVVIIRLNHSPRIPPFSLGVSPSDRVKE